MMAQEDQAEEEEEESKQNRSLFFIHTEKLK
jgi:hypothetical protein